MNKKLSIIESLKTNKKTQYLVLSFLVILLLIILVISFIPTNKTENNSSIDYIEQLEAKLEKTLSEIEGVGNVSVIIKAESGMETVIAKQTKITENGKIIQTDETPVLVNGKTIVLKELYPKITGVLIVAKGAENIGVLNKIQQATTSLLDVDIKNIEILAMK